MVVPCTAKTAQHQRNFGSTLSRYIMRPIAVAARLHRLATRRRESFEGVQRGNARRRSAFPRRDRNVRSRNGHLEGGVATGMLGEETGRSRRWRFFFFSFLCVSTESLYYAWESALFLAACWQQRREQWRPEGTRKEAQGKARKDGDAKKDGTREKE